MLQPVEPREGSTFSRDDFLKITYQALAGNFANARCLRLRIPFENVVGIRLLGKSVGVESDDGVVLILEIAEKLPPAAFAARKVHSKYHKENAFAIVPDWTPHQVASASTRFYLYGNLDELKRRYRLASLDKWISSSKLDRFRASDLFPCFQARHRCKTSSRLHWKPITRTNTNLRGQQAYHCYCQISQHYTKSSSQRFILCLRSRAVRQ